MPILLLLVFKEKIFSVKQDNCSLVAFQLDAGWENGRIKHSLETDQSVSSIRTTSPVESLTLLVMFRGSSGLEVKAASWSLNSVYIVSTISLSGWPWTPPNWIFSRRRKMTTMLKNSCRVRGKNTL